MRGPFPEMRIVFTEEFRRQVFNSGFILVTAAILGSIVVIGVMTVAAPRVTQSILVSVSMLLDDEASGLLKRTGYVDQAGVLAGPGLQDAPKRYDDSAQGIRAVRRGEIDTLFVLTAGYLESGAVEQYGTSPVGVTLGSGPATESAFSDFLKVELIAGRVEADVLARVSETGHYQSFQVAADGTITEAIPEAQRVVREFVLVILAALLPVAAMIGAGTMARSFTEDNETRMVEVLVTSASAFSVMAGKVAALVATGFVYITVWITVVAVATPAVLGRMAGGVMDFTMSPELLLAMSASFVLGYFLFSTLGLLVGTLASSPVQAQGRMSMLALLAGLPLGSLITADLDVLTAFSYIPLTAPSTLMLRFAQGDDVSDGETAAILALVAATGLLLLWTGVRIFRALMLLHGQRMTPGNVWTALRRAD